MHDERRRLYLILLRNGREKKRKIAKTLVQGVLWAYKKIPPSSTSSWEKNSFYVYGSVHRWSVLRIVQRDATQSSLFIILQVHSTCFGCQPHPSSGVHKTVTTTSGTVQLPPSNVVKGLATLEGGSCTQNMHSTGGCSYSFVYSWWWVWLTPETCRVNLQNNK